MTEQRRSAGRHPARWSLLRDRRAVTQNSMDVAVQAAARQIRIGNQRGTSDSGVRSIICKQMSAYMLNCPDLQINVASGVTFGSLSPATTTAGNLSQTGFTPGGSKSYVVIQVLYPTLAMLPAMLPFMPSPPVFVSTAVFQNEP